MKHVPAVIRLAPVLCAAAMNVLLVLDVWERARGRK